MMLSKAKVDKTYRFLQFFKLKEIKNICELNDLLISTANLKIYNVKFKFIFVTAAYIETRIYSGVTIAYFFLKGDSTYPLNLS